MPLQRLLILTGDPSADMHAAHVAQSIQQQAPHHVDIHAVGGAHLQQAGIALISDQSKMARMGFGGMILGAWDHWRLAQKILKHCDSFQPDAVLLIDYGVFHLYIAQALKKRFQSRCPKIYYFIPPQVWASRRGRIKKIKQRIDHVFCIFPFEKMLYQANEIPFTYVGHPLITQLPPKSDRVDFCREHGLEPDKPIVGIFPGSRKMEVDHLLLPFLEAATLLQQNSAHQHVQYVIAKASHFKNDYFNARMASANLPKFFPITVLQNANHSLLSVADTVIAASGTVTLEAALYGTPIVIAYKSHPLTFQIAKRIVQLPYFGLPNILHCIADINHPDDNLLPRVVPELLQKDVTATTIARHLATFLDPLAPETQQAKLAFHKIRQTLSLDSDIPAATRVAQSLLALI